MADKSELKGYIRYQLAQLSARNAEHEFERLAFEVARRRIASNLLPATGPVQAGGDQGRDFESYRSYLAGSGLRSGSAVAKIEGGILAGAVTINKKILGKIKSDLKTIFGSGERPTRVVYFCEANLPVAKRHILKEFCKTQYSAGLDIIDGEAIADMLADTDLHWIAERYLDIPANIWPVAEYDADYQQHRERWLIQTNTPQNYADFLQIKEGLRTATFEDDAKRDLARWIEIMRNFLADGMPERLIQKARYEIAVGELRGHGSLDPAMAEISSFFEAITPMRPAVELLDAAVLANYAFGSRLNGQSALSEQQVADWLNKTEDALKEALDQAPVGSEKCMLLEGWAMLAILPRPGETDRLPGMERFFERWGALLNEIAHQPLFPVSSIAKIFEALIDFIELSDRMKALLDKIDGLVAERAGKAAAADAARRRALLHLKSDRKIAAIDELHRMKSESFTGEHVRGAILSMLLLSQCYEDLGLHIAARHYASAALFLALHVEDEEIKSYIGTALFRISDTFYVAGEGATYLYSISTALIAHHNVASDPHDWTKHYKVQRSIAHATILRAIARRLTPAILSTIDQAIAQWPLPPHELDAFRSLSEAEPWSSMAETDILAQISENIGQHPFGDFGKIRSVRWSAFGILWEVKSAPERAVWTAALEVAASLQIAQVELADVDMLIIPSKVVVNVELSALAKPSCVQQPDNGALIWSVKMPNDTKTRTMEYQAALVGVLFSVMERASALPSDKISEIFVKKLDRGLPSRLSFVRPMRELLELAQPEGLDMAVLAAQERPSLSLDILPLENDELGWRDGPGPGYSVEKAREYIGNRYKVMIGGLRLTLPRMLADNRCRNLISKLRKEGCLDWHLLNVIYNIVGQWQVEKMGFSYQASPEKMKKALMDRMWRDESDSDPIFDLSVFAEDRIKMQLQMLPAIVFSTWRLANHRQTPDFSAMKKLLDARYGHSTDDVDHIDPFAYGS
ncbi:hypothetical protein [Siccirubricoccus phaeus]|uniref:hypothetical protein n=1 Tax=Siccirubricoccus phaeus TaxID=2595053 RepID=UPI0011F152BE|nr:hypothetical protein [Siccirubricoccus phaeus]